MKYMDLDVTHKRSMNVDRNRHDFVGFCEKFTYLKYMGKIYRYFCEKYF